MKKKRTLVTCLALAGICVLVLLGAHLVAPDSEEDRAHAALARVADVFCEYRDTHGTWPATWDSLGSNGTRSYDGTPITYDPTEVTLSVALSIRKRSLVHMLTGGVMGSVTETHGSTLHLKGYYGSKYDQPEEPSF